MFLYYITIIKKIYGKRTMVKFVLALDSYKNCISSLEAAKLIKAGIDSANNANQVEIIPLADGGEGTLQAIAFNNPQAKSTHILSCDAIQREHQTEFIDFNNSTKAFVELASICGIELLKSTELDVMNATTFGLGRVIKALINQGKKDLYIGIGSSASCDGGLGMLQALGAKFYDTNGKLINYNASGKTLLEVANIDFSEVEELIKGVNFTVCCDVNNPLTGPNGSAEVFAPQKGATPEMVKQLDAGLLNLFNIFKSLGHCQNESAGDGAAGGLGFSFRTILNAKLLSGSEVILSLSNFDKAIGSADFVITGEGCSDSQTINGKLPIIVAEKSKQVNPKIKTILLSGTIKNSETLGEYFDAVFSISSGPSSLSEAIANTSKNLYQFGVNLGRLF